MPIYHYKQTETLTLPMEFTYWLKDISGSSSVEPSVRSTLVFKFNQLYNYTPSTFPIEVVYWRNSELKPQEATSYFQAYNISPYGEMVMGENVQFFQWHSLVQKSASPLWAKDVASLKAGQILESTFKGSISLTATDTMGDEAYISLPLDWEGDMDFPDPFEQSEADFISTIRPDLPITMSVNLDYDYYAMEGGTPGEGLGGGFELIKDAVTSMSDIFSVQVMGGLTIGALVGIPLAVSVLLVVLRMFKK